MADRLGTIDPRMFVAQNAPVVEPRDALAVGQAVRAAPLQVEQLAQAQLQRPIVEAQAAMASDPKVLQAQKDLITQSAEAGKLTLDKAKQQAAIPENVLRANADLAKFGMQVFPDTGGQWSDSKSVEVLNLWGDLQNWQNEVAVAKMQDESIKEESVFDSTTGTTRVGPMFGGKPVSSDSSPKLKTWLTNNNNFRTWLGSGKQTAPRVIEGLTPGTASPAQVTPPPGRAPGWNEQPVPLATPAAPAPVAGPAVEPRTATASTPGLPADWGRVTKVEPVGEKPPTDLVAKARLAAGRQVSVDEILNNLKNEKGFDPSEFKNWVQGYFFGPLEALKSENQKAYETAKSGWVQGLLRLESGAAIAQKEQAWYEKTFFPAPGDGPEVQAMKASLRSDVEQTINSLAQTGKFNTADYLSARGAAEQAFGAGTPAAGASKVFKTSSGKSGKIIVAPGPDGKPTQYVVPDKAGSSKPYTAPATLTKSGKEVKVEKRIPRYGPF